MMAGRDVAVARCQPDPGRDVEERPQRSGVSGQSHAPRVIALLEAARAAIEGTDLEVFEGPIGPDGMVRLAREEPLGTFPHFQAYGPAADVWARTVAGVGWTFRWRPV